jgi:predicted phage terminase large subunit-like protein
MESVKTEKLRSGNEIAWQREYLLRIVSDTDRVIYPEWIQYYNPEEKPWGDHYYTDYVGVDLAISEKSGADCTAIVTLKICSDDGKKCAYVDRHPFNKRIPFPEQVNQIKMIATLPRNTSCYPKIFIEQVSYQEALIQQLRSTGLRTEGIPPHGDKRERLALTTAAIKEGLVKFPKNGAEELISQLIGFGVEKHDDLADAFSLVVNQFIILANKPRPGITFV